MRKNQTTPLTITLSIEAYRKIGELVPTQKQSITIRQILEAIIHFRGNYYELLALIAERKK